MDGFLTWQSSRFDKPDRLAGGKFLRCPSKHYLLDDGASVYDRMPKLDVHAAGAQL
jgi:hypothetical protein